MFAKLYPVLLLVVFPLVVLGPSIAKLFLVVLGGHLRRKTQQRRDILISRVKAERELLRLQSDGSRTSQDDDWEKVEDNGNAASNSATAAQSDKDWNVIIGFFHPFWWVYRVAMGGIGLTQRCLAMLVEVGRGFSGLRSGLRRIAIPKLFVSCTLEIMNATRSRCCEE